MFETRLKVVLIVFAVVAAVIVARLFDMQVVHGHDYRGQAIEALRLPAKVLPAVRGRILDRTGRELVSDEPCWEILIDYSVLAMNERAAGDWRRRMPGSHDLLADARDVDLWFQDQVDAMWSALAEFSGEPEDLLRGRGQETCDRIARIRGEVAQRRGFDSPVREEYLSHAIVTGLNDQQQVEARAAFASWPWVSIDAATRRVCHTGPAFAHVLGRTGPVAAENIANDPYRDDERRSYLGSERLGITGVECVAEDLLRGYRGRFQANRRGTILQDIDAERGRDAHLTIRADLQDALYDLLADRLAELPYSTGGAIVVLDVATRDCLALVSYPGFDPSRFQADYDELRRDTLRQPLRFRAVANQYMPGSIVKPLTCLAGLDTGAITLDTHFDCQGSLFPEHPDRWRCWPDHNSGNRMRHGTVDVTNAIKHSCNVFMYHTGQDLGVERLTAYFDMGGIGHVSGTGLIEEAPGINPTPAWLAEAKDTAPTAGLARLYAIGQGEVCATPIQVANLMAAYASGANRHVNLVAELRDTRVWTLPGPDAQWSAIRRGLYGVVNDSDGTARRTAYLEPSSGYALCGKTGSAEVVSPWVVSYTIRYVDEAEREGVALIPASTKNEAVAEFVRQHPGCAFDFRDVEVAATWPDRLPEHGRHHSHAWFGGYLQPLSPSGTPLPGRTPPIAFSVLVEFGGSGGRVAGPIGRDAALKIIELLGPDLDADANAARASADGHADRPPVPRALTEAAP